MSKSKKSAKLAIRATLAESSARALEAKNRELEVKLAVATAAPPAPPPPAPPPPAPKTHRQVHRELREQNPYAAAAYLLGHRHELDAPAPEAAR